VFVSTQRAAQRLEKRLWLVVRAGSPLASEGYYSFMEDMGDDDDGAAHTWNEVFMERPETLFALRAPARNRARLLGRVAQALDIELPQSVLTHDLQLASGGSSSSSSSSKSTVRPVKPTIETVTHTVARAGNAIVYHNDTVDPSAGGAGVLLGENPVLGPVLLRGPPKERAAFGGAWHTVERSHGAFPASTGRAAVAPGTSTGGGQAEVADDDDAAALAPFVFAGASHPRLRAGVYRSRGVDFKSKEAELGYQHVWGEMELRPVVVKLANLHTNDVA
jgi:hypothetical protein